MILLWIAHPHSFYYRHIGKSPISLALKRLKKISTELIPLSLNGILNNYCWDQFLWEIYPNNSMVWKELLKRYPYSTFQPKKIPLSLICSDLSLTPKIVPFSENSRTRMVTQLVKALLSSYLYPFSLFLILCFSCYPLHLAISERGHYWYKQSDTPIERGQ